MIHATKRMAPAEMARWKAQHQAAQALASAGPRDAEYLPTVQTVDVDWKADAERLAKAIEAIERSNGYGLDVPSWYGPSREWLVTADAIKVCKAALDAHRQLLEAQDADGN